MPIPAVRLIDSLDASLELVRNLGHAGLAGWHGGFLHTLAGLRSAADEARAFAGIRTLEDAATRHGRRFGPAAEGLAEWSRRAGQLAAATGHEIAAHWASHLTRLQEIHHPARPASGPTVAAREAVAATGTPRKVRRAA